MGLDDRDWFREKAARRDDPLGARRCLLTGDSL